MSEPVPGGLLSTRLTLRQPGTELPEPDADGLVPVPVTAVGGDGVAGGTAAVPGYCGGAVPGADPAQGAGTGTEAGTGTGDPAPPPPAGAPPAGIVKRFAGHLLYALGIVLGGTRQRWEHGRGGMVRGLMINPPEAIWAHIMWTRHHMWMRPLAKGEKPDWPYWFWLGTGYAYHILIGLPAHAAGSTLIGTFNRPIRGIPATMLIIYLIIRH
jgi:hypothetical protein